MAAFISEFIGSILAGVELALLIQHPAGAGCHPCWLSRHSLVSGHWRLWEKPDVGWEKTKNKNPFFNLPVTRKVTNQNMVFQLGAAESRRILSIPRHGVMKSWGGSRKCEF